MIITNQKVLRAQFRTAIEAIAPTITDQQISKWVYVRLQEEVGGAAVRSYTITSGPAEPEDGDEAVFGGGISYRYDMQVHVSYHDLRMEDDEVIQDADLVDLWAALHDVKLLNTGLIDVIHPVWTADDESQDGNVFGFYEVPIRYFGRSI